MATLTALRGEKIHIDDDDLVLVSPFRWYVQYKYQGGKRIRPIDVRALVGGTQVKLHKLLVAGYVVDHVNGDPLDNRRANLRACSAAENAKNRKLNANSKTRLKGVYQRKDRPHIWYAEIVCDGQKLFLGGFRRPELAAQAYAQAAERWHGQFSRHFSDPQTTTPQPEGQGVEGQGD